MAAKVLNTGIAKEEQAFEQSLRPRYLDEYIGQEKAKNTLRIYIEAARQRKDTLDHVLFYGPPGLGKTTLAGIIANELGVKMKVTSGPAIERPIDLVKVLINLGPGDVLFIDEVHRLNRQVEEVLYPAMEDFCVDVVQHEGSSGASRRIPLAPFTLVGATTRAGLLTAPLRDRFGVISHLELYSVDELKTIILRSAKVLDVPIEEEGALELARRSRGTPRLANRFLKRVRDYAQVRKDGVITGETAAEALDFLDVDSEGLDNIDREILMVMIDRFGGGPVGLDTLSASIGEDAGTVEDVYEPYLIKNGFIMRTPRGRVVLEKTYHHFGLEYVNED